MGGGRWRAALPRPPPARLRRPAGRACALAVVVSAMYADGDLPSPRSDCTSLVEIEAEWMAGMMMVRRRGKMKVQPELDRVRVIARNPNEGILESKRKFSTEALGEQLGKCWC